MNRPRRSLAVRDQAVSAFSGTLMRLCDATAARGAALVDGGGETVDYAGSLDPFEIRVVAAEWRLLLGVLAEQPSLSGGTTELFYRGTKRSFAVVSMQDGYALVVDLPRSSFRPSPRAIAEAVRTLAVEAGLPNNPSAGGGRENWTRLDVRCAAHWWRPTAIWLSGGWQPIDVLGRFSESEPGRRSVGYRIRLPQGTELTLVREPMGIWYVDELPAAPATTNGGKA